MLGTCNKHCAFLHHNPVSGVNRLALWQVSEPKFGSVTVLLPNARDTKIRRALGEDQPTKIFWRNM